MKIQMYRFYRTTSIRCTITDTPSSAAAMGRCATPEWTFVQSQYVEFGIDATTDVSLNASATFHPLSSVERVLRRHHLTRFSRWKKWHAYPPRSIPETPGKLVEIDTILDGVPSARLCVYTGLDVCSRFAFALPVSHINTHASPRFVEDARASGCAPPPISPK